MAVIDNNPRRILARSTWLLVSITPIVLLDQASKRWATAELMHTPPEPYFGGLFYLSYHINRGAMLSFGDGFPEGIRFFIFTLLVAIGLFAACVAFALCRVSRLAFTCAVLMIAGGLGNLYDRASNNGGVIDFMQVRLGPLATGVFNVADMAVTLGFVLFLWLSLRPNQPPSNGRG